MGTVILKITTKRPDWATHAKLLELLRSGLRPGQIATAIGVSPSRVTHMLARARELEKEKEAQEKGG